MKHKSNKIMENSVKRGGRKKRVTQYMKVKCVVVFLESKPDDIFLLYSIRNILSGESSHKQISHSHKYKVFVEHSFNRKFSCFLNYPTFTCFTYNCFFVFVFLVYFQMCINSIHGMFLCF